MLLFVFVMKNKRKLTKRLDDAISNSGSAMGPALTNLILYGPMDGDLISDNSRDILEFNTTLFEKIYNGSVLPKIGNIFHMLTQDNSNFQKNRRKLNRCFRKRSPDSIRKKIRDSYRGQFGLDSVTAEGLFSENKIWNKYDEGLKYCFDKGSNFIISKRYKNVDEMRKKYCVRFDKLNDNEREKILEFVVDVAENNYASWNNHARYLNDYGKNSLEMMLGDIFGVKIVDLDQRRAETTMERLVEVGLRINFRNFSIVRDRFRDHRDRNKELRPGGIHYTLIDKALPNYPIEIQFRSIKDECFNLFGEKAHYLYGLKGKKSNDIYAD